MPTPPNIWAKQARRRLIAALGGRCTNPKCGTTDIDVLEIDHKDGRDWTPRELSSSARVSRYRREAREGKLRVLCKSCNSRDGAYRFWDGINYFDYMQNGGARGLAEAREWFRQKYGDARGGRFDGGE